MQSSAAHALAEATLPDLPNHYRGKVRDNYDLPDGRRIIIASDRLSAFDRILAAVPHKGQVLTQMARYWFDRTADICPNHVLEYPDPNVVVGRRLTILPVEIVVRDYLAGTTGTSILTLYKQGQRRMYGHTFPDGLRDNQRLPQPIITPSSKAFDGGHDQPLTPDEVLAQGLLTAEQWEAVSTYALALFARGQRMAAERGLILVDTKYEFGTDADGQILLADEIHTPDSSRYWIAETYPARFAAGERPDSFDKDFMRSWVAARCDPYADAIPEIPPGMIADTSKVYIQAFEAITGQTFEPPAADEPVLDRIRRNLASYHRSADWTSIPQRTWEAANPRWIAEPSCAPPIRNRSVGGGSMQLFDPDLLWPVAGAIAAGGAIGLEREYRASPAGFRTHILVCLSSALLMLAAVHQVRWLTDTPSDIIRIDPVRMAHGVLTGIGFLCGGVIFREGFSVRGLTTAASLWSTSSLGILFGVGFYGLAVLGGLATLLVLAAVNLSEAVLPQRRYADIKVRYGAGATASVREFRELLVGHSLRPQAINQDITADAVEFSTTVGGYSESRAEALAADVRGRPALEGFQCLPHKS